MTKGELRRRILEHGKNYGYRDFKEALMGWIKDAREDIFSSIQVEYGKDTRISTITDVSKLIKSLFDWLGDE